MTKKEYVTNEKFNFHINTLFIFFIAIISIIALSSGLAFSQIQKNFNNNFKWVCVENITVEQYELINETSIKDVAEFCDKLHCKTEEMAIKFTGLKQPSWGQCQEKCREVHADEIRKSTRPYLRFYNETYCVKEKLEINDVYRDNKYII